MYYKTAGVMIKRASDGAFIPPDENNPDYVQFQEWQAQGGVLTDEPRNVTVAELKAQLTEEYQKRMAVISSGYPLEERESWNIQVEEATAILSNAGTPTPWIDTVAEARGITPQDLAERIAGKNTMYRLMHAQITGNRQAKEDVIDAIANDQASLDSFDVTANWPTLEQMVNKANAVVTGGNNASLA